MSKSAIKKEKRIRRHNRIRAKISGTADKPRLAVFRSNNFLYAQLIDDATAKTIVSSDTRKMNGKNARIKAKELGKDIAEKAKKENIEKVVFDRGGFLFAGSIKDFADGVRDGGLIF